MPGRAVSAEKRDLAAEPLTPRELNNYDVIILDPPRLGALDQVKMIARSDVKRVVYVSCGVHSFARDAAVLVKAGFEFRVLSVIDQFLWSSHVELVGVFVKPRR
jgi:23S rRNA (uracil1939-C5)-methyltransferase